MFDVCVVQESSVGLYNGSNQEAGGKSVLGSHVVFFLGGTGIAGAMRDVCGSRFIVIPRVRKLDSISAVSGT